MEQDISAAESSADAKRYQAVDDPRRNMHAFVRGVALLLLACMALMLLLLHGCAFSQQGGGSLSDADLTTETATEVLPDTATTSETSVSFETVAAAFNVSALDLDYSNRDKDATYDDASATHIELTGATATVDGFGAAVDGSTVTITAEGTYVVAGTLDDGQLVVETADTDKVQVVLAGASIHNEDGPAVYIKQTDKCFITLADGTVNTLTDGADYALETDSDEPYATLFSRDDLTLNGAGTLHVTSSYRHAVCSKDDLVITGGTYVIDAVEDALRGRDCVKISDGDFTLTAGGDGIKSNKDTDATRGFVSIDGGTFAIDAGDDGVQAVTYLRVAGGELEVNATDDALHSALEGAMTGGALTIAAGDDAFHAETVLTIDDGTFDVASCYEGYEAEKIYINGGSTHIVASDDAVNAAVADLSDDADVTTTDAATADTAEALPGGDTPATAGEGSEPPALPEGAESADEFVAPDDGTAPPDRGDGTTPPTGGMGGAPNGGEGTNEQELNGGAPDNAFAEGGMGGGGGMTMGDENCLIQINGGYTVLDAAGDAVDSNGNVEITGGVLLVNGPTSGGDGAFDYDLTATVSGGTVLMVGSTGMAQNFTSGTQPFAFTTTSGSAGESVAVVDGNGAVVASLTATKQFGMVLTSSSAFEEGGAYSLVVGGTVVGTNTDGYTDNGTVDGGTTTEITASTTATGGMGGLGAGGGGMPAGQGGDIQHGMRGGGEMGQQASA